MAIKSSAVERLAPISIEHVVFGLRYEPQWGLHDKVGAIVDAVLREEGTPFGPVTFPLNAVDPMQLMLHNEKTGDYLKINHQDAILKFTVDTRALTRITQLGEQFAHFVLQPLREIGRVRKIVRTGMLLQLADAKGNLKVPPIEKYISEDFKNVTNFGMRFTRRLPAEEALIKKRVSDYRQVIYSINEREKGDVNIGLDYQHYFAPPLEGGEWDERPFSKFVEHGLNYFEGEFQKWFQKLAGASEVA